MPEKETSGSQRPAAAKSARRRKLDIWNKIAVAILTCFLVGCISVFFILVNVINDPDGMRFSQEGLSTLSNSRMFDADGNLIYEFGNEIREDVTYDQIPQSVVDAFLSIEDSRFYDHHGFDLPRFLAAALSNLRSGTLGQGGSTLTMQMIDNAFTKIQEDKIKAEEGSVSKLESIKLKIQEIYLALIAEQSISKEDIFDYYVNRIWFGSSYNTRGIQKAAEYYFNKDVSQLNLGEAAFLAGAVNSPASYNPINNKYAAAEDATDYLQSATNRRNVTLKLMLDHGYITEEEYELAKNSRLEFALLETDMSTNDPNMPFIQQAIEEVQTLAGQDPFVIPMDIYTSLNQGAQKQCDDILRGRVDSVQYPNDAFDVGFSIIDNATGEILCVGPGRRYIQGQTDRDNSLDRKQPGSSMKPLLAYAPTFDLLGWSTVHTVNDKADDYFTTGQNLQNSDRRYQGLMSLQDALGVSKNTTAAAAMNDLIAATGLEYWQDYCRKLGYDQDVWEQFVAQYAIGGSNMWASPIQQASAYTIFANHGNRVNAHRVRRIVRRADKEEIAGNTTTEELISDQAAFMMSSLLEKVVTGGYQNFNEILKSSYTVYGKSGTSDWGVYGQQYGIPNGAIRDEWSVGYTNRYTIATWSGYTEEFQQQGYYINDQQLYMATAFHISHYMLDYMEQFGGYSPIARPDGVSDYKSGYIKTEFVDKGDETAPTYNTYQPSESEIRSACQASGGTYDEEAGICITKQEDDSAATACTGSGGTWDGTACSCPDGYELNGTACEAIDQSDPSAECGAQGGTWNGTYCEFPTQPEVPDSGGDDSVTGSENGETGGLIPPTGLIVPRFFGLFNLFNWL
ncbi:transglycosylase domain-containing protein [Faecalibaculum rodentium]|jgi:penicillin-binding protein 1A|uniref:transglycosylase domain-containing protein n=2 Tax=Faecalibaculum rodentium TaxID=1702221 RepID=UPI00249370C0|nr:transglycosylase domain-containing protein [Faecalibaculum rodentium]